MSFTDVIKIITLIEEEAPSLEAAGISLYQVIQTAIKDAKAVKAGNTP